MAEANGGNTGMDSRKLLMVVGGIVIVALIVVIVLVARGRGSSSTTAEGGADANAPSSMVGGMGGPGMGGSMSPGMGGGMGMGMGVGAAPTAGAAATATAAAPATPADPNAPRYTGIGPQPTRPDPFVALPAPKGFRTAGGTLVGQPIFPAPLISEQGINISSTGPLTHARRTAGLLWGNDAWGLLQIGDETYIVRTGDPVAGYTVTGITRDSIILYSPDLKKQIQVPLQGLRSQQPETYGDLPAAATRDASVAPRQGISLQQMEFAPGVPETPFE